MTDETAPPVAEPEAEPKTEPKPSLSLLAQQRFGNQYHGKVTEPADDPPDEGPDPDPEIEGEAEPEPKAEDEQEFIASVDELAEYLKETQGLDVEPEWFDSLQIKGKVNGEERTYTLSDLKAGVQKVDAADNILETAKQKVKEQQEEIQAQREKATEAFTVAASLIQDQESTLEQEYNAVDWAKLETEDPADYAAKKMRFQDRARELLQKKQNAAQKYQEFAANQKAETERLKEQRLIEEHAALVNRIPEWQNEEVAAKGKTEVANYLNSEYGFTADEIGQALDHRLIDMARKAYLYDQQATTQDVKKKKVAKIPKTLAPGGTKSKEQQNKSDVDAKMQRLRKTGSIDDALAVMRARKGAQ